MTVSVMKTASQVASLTSRLPRVASPFFGRDAVLRLQPPSDHHASDSDLFLGFALGQAGGLG